MCNVKELQEFVEEYWKSDFDIEVECKDMPTKIAIFSVDHYQNYWTYNPNKWHFGGYRLFVFPDVEFYPKYKNFVKRLKEHGIEDGTVVDLETAKKIVELMFGSKRTKYSEIKEALDEVEEE